MIRFELKHPNATHEMLGILPAFFFEGDPRPAREQINERYAAGGGWNPFRGHTMSDGGRFLRYPGDPPSRLIAEAKLHNEVLRFYEGEWLTIVQPDGSYETARVD